MPANRDKIPVIEMYGPVLQGEGSVIGMATMFVRLAACDYRCFYCDSMHAVDPAEIEKYKVMYGDEELAKEIVNRVISHNIPSVTFSGGNPALWPLDEVVKTVQSKGIKVAAETQGTVYKDWLAMCNYLTISPKGPGMVSSEMSLLGVKTMLEMLDKVLIARKGNAGITWPLLEDRNTSIKIPVFGVSDLDFAVGVRRALASNGWDIPMFLSVGNIQVVGAPRSAGEIRTLGELRAELLGSYNRIEELIFTKYPELMRCRVLPQMHVLQYGNELGR